MNYSNAVNNINTSLDIEKLRGSIRSCCYSSRAHKNIMILGIKCGSRHDSFGGRRIPIGTAHFVEHMIFNKPFGNIGDRFTEIGSVIYAYTTYSATYIVMYCFDRIVDNVRFMFDIAFAPYFTAENIVKERNIILQEVKNAKMEDCVNYEMMKKLFNNNGASHPIVGDARSIKSITSKDCVFLHDNAYTSNNVSLTFIGSEPNICKYKTALQNEIVRVPHGTIDLPFLFTSDEENNLEGSKRAVFVHKNRFGCIGVRLPQNSYYSAVSTQACMTLLLECLFSQSNMSENIRDTHDFVVRNRMLLGLPFISFSYLSDNPAFTAKSIVGDFERDISETTFADVKRKIVGKYLLSLDQRDILATTIMNCGWLHKTPSDLIEKLNSTTLDAVHSLKNCIYKIISEFE